MCVSVCSKSLGPIDVKFRCVLLADLASWQTRGGGAVGGDRRDTWERRVCCQPAGPLNPIALGKGCVYVSSKGLTISAHLLQYLAQLSLHFVCVCLSMSRIVCVCAFHLHCVCCSPHFNSTLYIYVEKTQPHPLDVGKGDGGLGVRGRYCTAVWGIGCRITNTASTPPSPSLSIKPMPIL